MLYIDYDMSFKLGNFFPKKSVNISFLDLNDPRWAELEGGYKTIPYDASIALKKLEQANSTKEADIIYQELWSELHHQGDIGLASYYAVPHLVRIAKEKKIVDYNVLGLVSLIEIQRHKGNPTMPKALYPAYSDALLQLPELVTSILSQNWDLDTASTALTALAIAKGQLKLANAIQNLDSDDRLEEFLEQYG